MDALTAGLSPGLGAVLTCIASVVEEVSDMLRRGPAMDESGSENLFGDKQLKVDVEADRLIFSRLSECSSVQAASSEEQPELVPMSGKGYTVAFDPLDGSSIVGANFAVGSIFGVWPTANPVGETCRSQIASLYAVYGPQTVLVCARPRPGQSEEPSTSGTAASETHLVQEFILSKGGWRLKRDNIVISPTSKVFAPANLRCASENKAYAALVQKWIEGQYTLRYTGGMVPDVHHIIAKGHGVFCNPCSTAAPAKLRLLYECAPLALIIEAAGGSSSDGHGSLLDQAVVSCAARTKVCLGSSELVKESLPALQAA